ncbi:MAG: GNAT family N-acetyltransferase [Chitinophagaceae bacterium]|nr:MAG: GNAT family N-acetyltransferase [Chitinophagaceae bacterium]
MKLTWTYKSFNELTTLELYSILKLRSEVFVVEQNCAYQDVDSKDIKSYHLMAFDGETLAAYSRILPPGLSFQEASIGRVITAPSHRAKGIGITLIEKAIEAVSNTFHTSQIKIGAQLYLRKFYESFGFAQTSDVYLEDGIEHIEMLLKK